MMYSFFITGFLTGLVTGVYTYYNINKWRK